MTASCISSCVILLLCSHLTEVSTNEELKDRFGRPLDKVRTDIEALNQTVRELQNQKEEMQQSINAWNAKMLMCMTPPYIEGANIAMETDSNGDFKATYSCREGYKIIGGSNLISYCSIGVWSQVDLRCTDYTDCYGLHDGRAVYGGKVYTTAKGAVCQAWTSQYPHEHVYGDDWRFIQTNGITTETAASASNFCRDPEPNGYLWCYTQDSSSRWDYCSVPPC